MCVCEVLLESTPLLKISKIYVIGAKTCINYYFNYTFLLHFSFQFFNFILQLSHTVNSVTYKSKEKPIANYNYITESHSVNFDYRKILMSLTLVMNDQQSFYLHHFNMIIFPILFCVCKISIYSFIELQYIHVLSL